MFSKKIITYTGLLNDVYSRPKDIDNKEVVQLLQQAEAIPQKLLPFKGHIFVLDYTQRRHVGFSGQTKSMTGYDPRDIMNGGIDFVIDVFQKDDFKIYNETIFNKITAFLKEVPYAQHSDFVFSFTHRLRKADGKWVHLFQQGSYITDPKSHLPFCAIGVSTDISPLKKDNSITFSIDKKKTETRMFDYSNILTDHYYPDPEEARLSKREREVLGRLADGLTSKEIAGKLHLSENTVVNHRKNILKKTSTKNVAELIRFAFHKGII